MHTRISAGAGRHPWFFFNMIPIDCKITNLSLYLCTTPLTALHIHWHLTWIVHVVTITCGNYFENWWCSTDNVAQGYHFYKDAYLGFRWCHVTQRVLIAISVATEIDQHVARSIHFKLVLTFELSFKEKHILEVKPLHALKQF